MLRQRLLGLCHLHCRPLSTALLPLDNSTAALSLAAALAALSLAAASDHSTAALSLPAASDHSTAALSLAAALGLDVRGLVSVQQAGCTYEGSV